MFTPVLLDVDIPINGPADVILLIIVLLFCIGAGRIIAGFFKKPAVKHKEDAGGDNIRETETAREDKR